MLLTKLSEKLYSVITGKRLLILLVIYIVFEAVMLILQTKMKAMTKVGFFDFEAFYDAPKAFDMLAKYGDAGKMFQIEMTSLDMFYIPVYTLFFCGLITFFLSKPLATGNKWRLLNLFPIIVGLIDYMENIGVLTMVFSPSSQLTTVANITGMITFAKFNAATINIAIPIISLIIFIWFKLKNRNN